MEENQKIDIDSENSITHKEAVAFFRLQIISPMLDAPKGEIDATAKKLAKKQFRDVLNNKMVSYHERTIYEYYMNFKKNNLKGLMPKTYENKDTHPSVPDEIIKEITSLKKELPTRSANKIITLLELNNLVEKDYLHPRTVNRILKEKGYTTQSLRNSNRTHKKFEKKEIGKLWQSDVMHATYLPDGNGNKKMVYLIGFLDDHSRRLTHAQFYFDSTLPRLEDCLKKAVIKFGAPEALYVDNGRIYISKNFKLICARLGIRLKYAKPYHPEGKGKIEKLWQFIQKSFISELKNKHVNNIVELNDLFSAWLKVEYHDKVHTSLGMTPVEKWEQSKDKGARLQYFSPVEIDEAFLHYDQRKVDKYGTISFQGNSYEVDGTLVGKKVGLRYDPFHLDEVHIYHKEKYFGLARIIDLDKQKHKDVQKIKEDPVVTSKASEKYFENIKSDYQKYLEKQLDEPVEIVNDQVKIQNDKEKKDNKKDENNDDENQNQVPDKKTKAIKRKKFVDIVTSSLDLNHLSFAQKGKLYELWETFKEFNPEYLKSIIDDIKNKSSDYNDNFLYYLAQIKDLYLQKLKDKSKKAKGGK